MERFSVLRINGLGGSCFHCGNPSSMIVGSDYDVCGNTECFEIALEKKEYDMAYVSRRINEIKGLNRFEARLDK